MRDCSYKLDLRNVGIFIQKLDNVSLHFRELSVTLKDYEDDFSEREKTLFKEVTCSYILKQPNKTFIVIAHLNRDCRKDSFYCNLDIEAFPISLDLKSELMKWIGKYGEWIDWDKDEIVHDGIKNTWFI